MRPRPRQAGLAQIRKIFFNPQLLPLSFSSQQINYLAYQSLRNTIKCTKDQFGSSCIIIAQQFYQTSYHTMSGKDFIIKHMNADHGDSLQLYLQAYCRISASQAKSATLEDLNLSSLTLKANGTRYSVPIDPPMTNFNEARGRLVALHKDSLQKLGRSEITLTEYRAPRGHQIVIFALCAFTYVSCFSRENLLPGSFVYENLGYKFFPDFAHFVYNIQPFLFPAMLGIHIFESALLAILKLKPHGVQFLSGLWLAWVASCMVEGFGTFQRINRIVKEKSEKKH